MDYLLPTLTIYILHIQQGLSKKKNKTKNKPYNVEHEQEIKITELNRPWVKTKILIISIAREKN
jgi:hypothetical protein